MWKRGNCSRSSRSTRRPRRASAVAVLEPPGPPPMTTASKSQLPVALVTVRPVRRWKRSPPDQPSRRLRVHARDRLLVLARAHGAGGEDLVLGDPLEGLVEDLLRIGLEHDPLPGAPAPRVHQRVEADRKLVPVVVGVAIGPDVDVALRALE